jgi:hypothetical protein
MRPVERPPALRALLAAAVEWDACWAAALAEREAALLVAAQQPAAAAAGPPTVAAAASVPAAEAGAPGGGEAQQDIGDAGSRSGATDSSGGARGEDPRPPGALWGDASALASAAAAAARGYRCVPRGWAPVGRLLDAAGAALEACAGGADGAGPAAAAAAAAAQLQAARGLVRAARLLGRHGLAASLTELQAGPGELMALLEGLLARALARSGGPGGVAGSAGVCERSGSRGGGWDDARWAQLWRDTSEALVAVAAAAAVRAGAPVVPAAAGAAQGDPAPTSAHPAQAPPLAGAPAAPRLEEVAALFLGALLRAGRLRLAAAFIPGAPAPEGPAAPEGRTALEGPVAPAAPRSTRVPEPQLIAPRVAAARAMSSDMPGAAGLLAAGEAEAVVLAVARDLVASAAAPGAPAVGLAAACLQLLPGSRVRASKGAQAGARRGLPTHPCFTPAADGLASLHAEVCFAADKPGAPSYVGGRVAAEGGGGPGSPAQPLRRCAVACAAGDAPGAARPVTRRAAGRRASPCSKRPRERRRQRQRLQ